MICPTAETCHFLLFGTLPGGKSSPNFQTEHVPETLLPRTYGSFSTCPQRSENRSDPVKRILQYLGFLYVLEKVRNATRNSLTRFPRGSPFAMRLSWMDSLTHVKRVLWKLEAQWNKCRRNHRTEAESKNRTDRLYIKVIPLADCMRIRSPFAGISGDPSRKIYGAKFPAGIPRPDFSRPGFHENPPN